MIELLFGLLFAFCTVLIAAIIRAYHQIPLKEIKRRAAKGDELASVLYRAAGYGISLQVLLIGIGLVFGYFSIVLLEDSLGVWMATLTIIVFVVLGSILVASNGGPDAVSVRLAAKVSPALAWATERLHPLLTTIGRIVQKFMPVHIHTGVYEKADIAQLLELQKQQTDNRIPVGEIDIILHALTFGDKTVTDTLIPKRVVKSVSANDQVGPILMGELHASGHSRFPVHDSTEPDTLVGVLYLRDLVEQKGSKLVEKVMRPGVMYVHEEFTLYETLQAFLKTKQHLFIVVNSFEEYVGIITIEDIIEQVIGKRIVDEFDQYDDLRAVARRFAKNDHDKHVNNHADAHVTEEFHGQAEEQNFSVSEADVTRDNETITDSKAP